MRLRSTEMHFIRRPPLILLCMCFILLSRVNGRMNDTLRNKFLTLHNDVRQTVRNGQLKGQPTAVSIEPMKYNLELEKKAQTLSEQCRAGHDRAVDRKVSPFQYVGQNWAGAGTIELGFKSWLDENKHYDYFKVIVEKVNVMNIHRLSGKKLPILVAV
uniref:SCP domain-containing protein n=1 Tax=Trichobilharzia regenti TaxID=157069 RepID=A0AA85J318_TRIRE|nr:unnamed protein product [Trichobilharzia regenti]